MKALYPFGPLNILLALSLGGLPQRSSNQGQESRHDTCASVLINYETQTAFRLCLCSKHRIENQVPVFWRCDR